MIEYQLNELEDGGDERHRLITTILDHEPAPAKELAALYQQHWKSETSFRELKITQGRPGLVFRSREPDGVT